jgi:two-component system, OmpR family, phosphate regulon sensor histidine kinase PhoR
MLLSWILLYFSLAVIAVLLIILILLSARIKKLDNLLSESRIIMESGISRLAKKSTLSYPEGTNAEGGLTVDYIKSAVARIIDVLDNEIKLVDMVIENMAHGVLILNNKREVIRINESLINLFYLKKEESLRKKTIFIFRNDRLENLIGRAVEKLVTLEENITFYGDEDMYLNVEVIPLIKEKQEAESVKPNFLVLFKNITQEIEFSRLRSQFVANVSHEMRTPLTSIKGYIDTILEDRSIERETMRDYLEKSLGEVERLNFLIKDVLNLSSIEYKRNIIFERNYNIVDLIKDAIESLNFLAEKNNIKINFNYDNDVIDFQTDEGLFIQIIKNIIENSIFYGGADTEINIDLREKDDRVIIRFKDNGAGIEKEELPYIFQRFYRGKRWRSSKQIGSGLGLSIVKHAVELHNGKINVGSIPGKETVFEAVLPKVKNNKQGIRG